MADDKTSAKTDTKATTTPAADSRSSKTTRNLPPAGESSDPNVQTLLAELESARLNDNEADAQQVIDRIAELGFHAE